MAELIDATGLSERTIRYYISEGLVSPALGRGRSRYYTPRHLQELTRVTDLREQRLSVAEIRQQMLAVPRHSDSLESAPAWHRVVLHPSLELHVRDGAPESILALARQLEAQSREWLGDDDDLVAGT
jgi:DNA-binding transcriptional MerR regulator